MNRSLGHNLQLLPAGARRKYCGSRVHCGSETFCCAVPIEQPRRARATQRPDEYNCCAGCLNGHYIMDKQLVSEWRERVKRSNFLWKQKSPKKLLKDQPVKLSLAFTESTTLLSPLHQMCWRTIICPLSAVLSRELKQETAIRLYSETTMEPAMKVHEVILGAFAKQISWIQAPEIRGHSPRQVRRMKSN